ncbi:hypothetical protein NMD99_01585 [Wolbachia endosymbiont of Listronotus oregonensis]|nr:hypothetical protein [Wolbachia endosymbiont of Listronotus oregonensis]WMT84728.1 hypothetical protein NMD99_01585 [Wolbachia endosymbiont of Listronotus oregonensis]
MLELKYNRNFVIILAVGANEVVCYSINAIQFSLRVFWVTRKG